MINGQPQGYFALPDSGEGAGVLVLHPWWGLNETMRAFCRRLAESGFVAFAPDLYHGQVTDTIEGAEALATALDEQKASSEVATAVRFLNGRSTPHASGIAIVGFSLGAAFALEAAAALPALVHTVVLFYGVGGADFGKSQATYLGHFAADDPYEPPENVAWLEASLKEAGRPFTFHNYPNTSHWFFEPDREDAYDETAAELAWQRTLAFLQSKELAPDVRD